MAVVVIAVAVWWLSLGILTVAGSRRRGPVTLVRAAVTLLAFPIAWAVWYRADRRALVERSVR